ncbi:hypothetical protein J6590_007198 [Homalodisca vitripennis]|nr:hypothetical protein J6590_007198 [Homalodisca vitripennis]
MLTVLTKPGTASTLTLLSITHGLPHVPHRNMTNVAPLHGGINILLGGLSTCIDDFYRRPFSSRNVMAVIGHVTKAINSGVKENLVRMFCSVLLVTQ